MPASSMKLSIKIGIPFAAFSEASKGFIEAALHAHSPELADFERRNVRQRTRERARDTGALTESADSRAYKSPKSRQLIKLFYDEEPQLFEWHRVYDRFNEGPPIGVTSPTIPEPRHMLYDVLEDDADQIEQWAVKVTQDALDEWTALAQMEADAKAAEGVA